MAADFSQYLGPGEIIRWTGQPQQGLVLRMIDGLLVPFSLLWCGFAVFWEMTVWKSGGPPFFLLWGGAFVCVGLYFVFGRFLVDAYLRSKIQYALTDQRALILAGFKGNDLTSIDLRTTSEVRYKDIDGSRGTISFGPNPGPFLHQSMLWHSTSRNAPEFFRTSDAANAYRLIQAAKNAPTAGV